MIDLFYIFITIGTVEVRTLWVCIGSGHENYYSPELDLLNLYGNKLIALHLHANDGTQDTHALPFSGNINWNKISSKLKSLNYQGAIALETLNKGFENINDPVEFLYIALARAKRIG